MPRHNDASCMSKEPSINVKRSFRQRRARSNLRQLRHLRQNRQFRHSPKSIVPSSRQREDEKWYETILRSYECPVKTTKKGVVNSSSKKIVSTQKRQAQKNVLPKRTRMRLLQKMKKVNWELRKLYEENEISSSSEEYTSETDSATKEDDIDIDAVFYSIEL